MTATQPPPPLTPIAPARPAVIAARTEAELAAVRDLRLRVFGDEQGMVDAHATDPDDARSLHALAVVADGRARVPVATGRLTLGYGERGEALVAWVATLPAYRRSGLGSAVIRFLLAAADRAGAPVVVLSAQVHAIPFYRRLGFAPFGHRFHVRGIEHQWMGRPGPDASSQ